MGIFKHFAIKESTALEFRAEAFNIFNHPQFYIANNSGTNQTVGMSCLMPAGGTAGELYRARWLRLRPDQQRSLGPCHAIQLEVPLLARLQMKPTSPASQEAGFFC